MKSEALSRSLEKCPRRIEATKKETGQHFGEVALMSGEQRAFSAIIHDECHFLTLQKDHFKETIEQLEIERHQKL